MASHLQRSLPIKPNRHGRLPPRGATGTFEGLVAGPGFSETSVFTSPNQLFVPQFAIAHNEIMTYDDGRWGLHEYSRWPQEYDPACVHVACIPRQGAPGSPEAAVVWRVWERSDWESDTCGVARIGMLNSQLHLELELAAERAINRVYRCRQDCIPMNETVRLLILCLRHCLDRLRLLPSERSVVISLAAHVQRLILELAGVRVYLDMVLERIASAREYRLDVLDVIGAHTADASAADLLHRVGVPVWFQQHITPHLRIWSVVELTEPAIFSSVPSYPRLVLATRDLSGALNTPGESMRAMNAIVRRQLCDSCLPELIVAAADELDADVGNKRARLETQWNHQWDSSIGGAKPTLVVRNPRHTHTLPHALPVAPQHGSAGKRVSKARGTHPRPLPASGSSFTMNPFRQYYPSSLLAHIPAWTHALAAVSPLPQPSKSVKYFFPPPWLLDRLVGYPVSSDKLTRYVHHWIAIRTFCRLRLFDRTLAGRPLTISEWRDALWGDYSLDGPTDGDDVQPSTSPAGGARDRLKRRHQLKQSLRELFCNVAALPSYESTACPVFGRVTVSRDVISNDVSLHKRVVWELHETNWRCELLALDAVMVGSRDWPEMRRWAREAHISEVWGPPRSGLNVVPDVDSADDCLWPDEADADWAQGRQPLRALVDLLSRWQGCPPGLQLGCDHIETCGREEYGRIQRAAVAFYVRTFVDVFERLPIPPVRRPPQTRPSMRWRSGVLSIRLGPALTS
ncbi:hypothetical protein K466DRAFT_638308 [Polyporus arcularius HHB13444]|uniref:Uncharacterized protein n=1 Tax=Polyporus arcularius HHB13444 TaxID=1314778 RepID=A0A5C3NS77_9APHY|nr:hypothetical protein K466DRAFT_638308 [Polyporus arcularius HHB13444]